MTNIPFRCFHLPTFASPSKEKYTHEVDQGIETFLRLEMVP